MTDELTGIDPSLLEFNDPPRLVWISVQDAATLLWRDNPKLHDVGSLCRSVVQSGYKEPAIYSSKLFRAGQPETDGEPLGAFQVGNGRLEALARLELGGDADLPRGLAAHTQTGAWVVWVVAGTDAKSRAMAEAYAVDSNLLAMAGGDYSALDMSRMWRERDYLDLLEQLARHDAMPVSADGDDLDLLKKVLETEPEQEEAERGQGDWHEIRLRVGASTFDLYTDLMERAEGEDKADKFHNLMQLANDFLNEVL
jgi:hypothetical protein